MICPYCDSDELKVVDKRSSDEKTFRRRRECEKCNKRFTTYERVELVPLTIIKRDGRREEFDRNKIRLGIMKACEKRSISQEKIEKIVDEIENELRNMDTTEIKSKIIGDMIMEKLKNLDEVAYIRFASVYKKFKDIESFEKELKELKKGE
ncbi:MAG: transcriptional repressor NrdR [Candidatus Aenigmarchaeota archaeon]|nr:transcriptional repressor NrdR [Candidatus Aenigmarchaeota archaeon]